MQWLSSKRHKVTDNFRTLALQYLIIIIVLCAAMTALTFFLSGLIWIGVKLVLSNNFWALWWSIFGLLALYALVKLASHLPFLMVAQLPRFFKCKHCGYWDAANITLLNRNSVVCSNCNGAM